MNRQELEQLENEVKFGAYSQQVLNNPAFKQAMLERKTQIFDLFCKTTAEQTEHREEAWRTMQNLIALEQYFQENLDSAKMAETQLDKQIS